MSGMDALNAWVEDAARLTKPDRVVWLDGSEEEYQGLIAGMLADGKMTQLNENAYPNSYLYRSAPSDVARTEGDTYICTTRKEDAGPNNNWMAPDEAKNLVRPLFDGVMRGRTMYVIPYLMGPAGSPLARVGVEVTDSRYVAASMRIMTRMGTIALDHLKAHDGGFFPGLHSIADLDPNHRYILHFPEENLVWSINSGYGGNALLGKKCLSLRLASWAGWKEGWLAEHMLILGLQDPSGNVTYMAGAFPSACGKTNLAMLVSPLADRGWRVWTVGDDIAWMRVGDDGRLWAVNPEHGFFGVAPGTNAETNPNAMTTLSRNSIFTNTALTPDGTPWWDEITPDQKTPPAGTLDWQGQPWERGDGEKPRIAAHPNSRFTAPAGQCPSISPEWENPQGVPISAFIFGGRRKRVAPLVYQSFNWRHGVFVGASMASEQTAAVDGAIVGKVRRDPMAMLPFCGYNMGDYFAHWLAMGEKLSQPPVVFHVNWFRKDANGEFLWPGYGQNVRALMWMYERINQTGKAQETAIGYVPTPDGLDLDGLDISPETIAELLRVDHEDWAKEAADLEPFFAQFGDHLPAAITEEREALQARLSGAPVAP
ncbi:MAG TPA: phosphoenolpyruvate carboxykinase (GTP) [Ktedonobacterales bacterium]|nr:phosphoenolpyruvate carboxykinase (GTP) [Ktedonobacterales bacterium]